MCLTHKDLKPTVKSGFGYKVFYRCDDGKLKPALRNFTVIPVNKWTTDKRKEDIYAFYLGSYKSGYHICPTLREAEAFYDAFCEASYYRIRMVEFSNVVATGQQSICSYECPYLNVIVAKKIRILTLKEEASHGQLQ